MNAARRLYLYGVSAISLLVLSFAVVNLLALALARLGFAINGDDVLVGGDALRRSATFSVALALVTLPVWLLHWWLAERAGDEPHEEDRVSLIRAGFLLSVCGIAFIILAIRANDLIDGLLSTWLGNATTFSDQVDFERVYAWLVVSGSVLTYHALVRQRDVATGAMTGPSDWIGRLFIHFVALVGAWMLLIGTARLLAVTFDVIDQQRTFTESQPWVDPIASGSALALTGFAIWAVSWTYSLRRLARADWIGDRWRSSDIRCGYLAGLGLVTTLVVMVLLSQTIGAMTARLIVESRDTDRVAVDIAKHAARSLPFIVFAVYHFRQARLEAIDNAVEPARTGTARVLRYAAALSGVAFTTYGVAGVVALALDGLDASGGEVLAADDGWQRDLARLLGVTIVGTAVWLWNWRRVTGTIADEAGMAAHPDAERHALSRRVYLFAISGGAVIALFLSVAALVYRLLAALLGVSDGDGLDIELSGPLAVVIVAAPLLLYHLLELRADAANRPDALPDKIVTPDVVSVQLVLSGPSLTALHETAASLNASLPEGLALVIRDLDA